MFDFIFRRDPALDRSLLKAAEAGDADGLEALLVRGARANARNPDDLRTAAHLAAKAGRLDILKILRRHKADLSADDRDGDVPLDLAIHAGHLDIVRGLFDMGVKASNPMMKDRYDPVYRAAYSGHDAILRLLHDRGCAIDKETSIYTKKEVFDVTPLHAAAMENRLDCIRTLLNLGAKVNKGSVPSVFWAVRHRHPEAMEILLGAGCFVTSKVLAESQKGPRSPALVQRLETSLRTNPPTWNYRVSMLLRPLAKLC